jgi:pyruvate kinase
MNLHDATTGSRLAHPRSPTSLAHVAHCLEFRWRQRALTDDDLILGTSVGYPRSGNRMNLIQTHAVADLAGTLGWTR